MDVYVEPLRTLVKRSPVVVDVNASLREVAGILTEERVGAALVYRTLVSDAEVSHPPGVISERDISRAVAGGLDLDETRAGDVMAVAVAAADARETIWRAAARMLANGIRHLPVRDGGRFIGVVSERDVLGAFLHEVEK